MLSVPLSDGDVLLINGLEESRPTAAWGHYLTNFCLSCRVHGMVVTGLATFDDWLEAYGQHAVEHVPDIRAQGERAIDHLMSLRWDEVTCSDDYSI